MAQRVSPTTAIRAEIDQLFASEDELLAAREGWRSGHLKRVW